MVFQKLQEKKEFISTVQKQKLENNIIDLNETKNQKNLITNKNKNNYNRNENYKQKQFINDLNKKTIFLIVNERKQMSLPEKFGNFLIEKSSDNLLKIINNEEEKSIKEIILQKKELIKNIFSKAKNSIKELVLKQLTKKKLTHEEKKVLNTIKKNKLDLDFSLIKTRDQAVNNLLIEFDRWITVRKYVYDDKIPSYINDDEFMDDDDFYDEDFDDFEDDEIGYFEREECSKYLLKTRYVDLKKNYDNMRWSKRWYDAYELLRPFGRTKPRPYCFRYDKSGKMFPGINPGQPIRQPIIRYLYKRSISNIKQARSNGNISNVQKGRSNGEIQQIDKFHPSNYYYPNNNKGGFKSICPVFFDFETAEDFLEDSIEDDLDILEDIRKEASYIERKKDKKYKLKEEALADPVLRSEIIKIGLGDFIRYYSQFDLKPNDAVIKRKNPLDKIEFLFIPDLKELIKLEKLEKKNYIQRIFNKIPIFFFGTEKQKILKIKQPLSFNDYKRIYYSLK